jgi:hypothetical protein
MTRAATSRINVEKSATSADADVDFEEQKTLASVGATASAVS